MALYRVRMVCLQSSQIRPASVCLRLCSSTSNDDDSATKEQTKIDAKKKKAQAASKKLEELFLKLKVEPKSSLKSGLNTKLSRPYNAEKAGGSTLLKIKTEEKKRFSDIDPLMAKAIQSVASGIGGDVTETESELIQSLRSYNCETKEAKDKPDFSGIFSGMKIEKERPSSKVQLYDQQVSRPTPRENFKEKQHGRETRRFEDIFGGTPLGIFKKKVEDQKDQPMTMWDKCQERELNNLLMAPPENAFAEMIRWTEQGKLWRFPIDNEQGMEKEQAVPFHEHVFLEKHLRDGLPKTGPVRHFMELVCVGLSKNPYLTVERKLEHIQWYRDYFQRKEADLRELEVVKEVKVQ